MSINLTDELIAKTKKGKLASAKQVYLDGDQENLQQVGEKTHQLEQSIKDIAASGGASVASAVTYDNEASGMTSVTAQGAIDELATKDKSQDAEIAKKANSSDVDSQMQTEQTRVNAELDKKFDKKNIAQELGDAEDKVVSQYALPFRIEESPEWAYLIKDAENHVLFGIQQDGSVEWQVGIPTPIRKRFEEIISSVSDDKSELSTKIEELNTSLSAEIQSLQDTKVDKEEGKSLIDDEVKDCFKIVENDEFIHCIQDAEEHILFAIRRDTGKPYFPLNEMYHVEQNEEYVALWLDSANHILMGIRRDGIIVGEINACNALRKVIDDIQADVAELQSIEPSLKELLNTFTFQENDEYLAVETDSEGKILSSTNADGSHYIHNVKSETLDKISTSVDTKVDKEEGKSLIDDEVATYQSVIDDQEERMEIKTDSDGKIISYRDKESILHEENLSVNHLYLSENAAKEVNDTFKSLNIKLENSMDWSNAADVHIPIPSCAKLNIISSVLPTNKSGMGTKGITSDIPCYVEFWDMQGNYFKKPIFLSAQGDSSLTFKKKNFAIDLYLNEEERNTEGITFPIKFGDWVSQDSFHLKAYYTDFFRGVGAVGYSLAEEVAKTRSIFDDRPYKQLFTSKYTSATADMSDELNINLDTGAKCFPMGFPVIVYHNSEFYGIYSWQLKKHRDNYCMNKKTPEHIHLDGTLNNSTLFGGNISWYNFEIRNPKNLYTKNGSKYNGDSPSEIMGTEDDAYDPNNKDMVRCAKVKKYIQNLSGYMAELNQAVSDGKSEDEIKTIFESHFMVSNMIDFMLVNNVIGNSDNFNKNWQWTTWDGKLWTANLYDLDGCYGAWFIGNSAFDPQKYLYGNDMTIPTGWIVRYYLNDLETRYAELRNAGLFSASHITRLLKDWCDKIGYDNYSLEYTKWNESPSNRDRCLNSDNWKLTSNYFIANWSNQQNYSKGALVVKHDKVYKSLITENMGKDPEIDNGDNWEDVSYNPEKQYTTGDMCGYGKTLFYSFQCTQDSINIPPLSKLYNEYPYELGYHDNIYRVYNWLKQRISYMDSVFNFLNV